MNVFISKNAELFHKAIEDIWISEQIWKVTPNNAVWHCTQAVEKILKGYLKCTGKNYEHGHELIALLEDVEVYTTLTPDTVRYIHFLNRYSTGLRYKHMTSDPTADDAKLAIERAKCILSEFNNLATVKEHIQEAKEVHKKALGKLND
ncbi:MAG: HEPN domain-containing protein [Oscillospiraceae bacterium]|nr:HEPN domain-containing protein [Oscillospiraceae bacterium]